jgi:hypothetical protein
VPRYLSTGLINSIRVDELQLLRGRFPEIVNGLTTDDHYDPEEGSMPENQVEEVLQTWEAIKSLDPTGEVEPLAACASRVIEATNLYERIKLSPGMRLMGRSNGDHLESIYASLLLFAELAEIDLGG